jgi:hypothetical protein
MIKKFLFHQLDCDVLGVLEKLFRAIYRPSWSNVIQLLDGQFTTTRSSDLRTISQEISQPIHITSAHSETRPHDIIQYLMVDGLVIGLKVDQHQSANMTLIHGLQQCVDNADDKRLRQVERT